MTAGVFKEQIITESQEESNSRSERTYTDRSHVCQQGKLGSCVASVDSVASCRTATSKPLSVKPPVCAAIVGLSLSLLIPL
jgi:hypothetical protein